MQSGARVGLPNFPLEILVASCLNQQVSDAHSPVLGTLLRKENALLTSYARLPRKGTPVELRLSKTTQDGAVK